MIFVSAILLLLILNNFAINRLINRFIFILKSLNDANLSYERFQELILIEEKFNLLAKNNSHNFPFRNDNNLLTVSIYSYYPFNDRSKIIINAGSVDGLKVGWPVLAAEGVLLGKITKVGKHLSEVQTIFDPTWRSTVGIGAQKVPALLNGGLTPIFDLIEPTAEIEEGMMVINLTPDFPYGLLLGRVANFKKTPAQPWISGQLDTFYNITNLNRLLVVTDHE